MRTRILATASLAMTAFTAGCDLVVDEARSRTCGNRDPIETIVPDWSQVPQGTPLVLWVGDTSYVGAAARTDLSEFCSPDIVVYHASSKPFTWVSSDRSVEMLPGGAAIGKGVGSSIVTAEYRAARSYGTMIRVGPAVDHRSIDVTGTLKVGDTLTAMLSFLDAGGHPVPNAIFIRNRAQYTSGTGSLGWIDTSSTALSNSFVPTLAGTYSLTVTLPRLGHTAMVLSKDVVITK
jgi:hypothetical protein